MQRALSGNIRGCKPGRGQAPAFLLFSPGQLCFLLAEYCGKDQCAEGPKERQTHHPHPHTNMLVLFETPAGYALFKVHNEGKLQEANVAKDFATLEGAQKVYDFAS